jgi:hypothetical protein
MRGNDCQPDVSKVVNRSIMFNRTKRSDASRLLYFICIAAAVVGLCELRLFSQRSSDFRTEERDSNISFRVTSSLNDKKTVDGDIVLDVEISNHGTKPIVIYGGESALQDVRLSLQVMAVSGPPRLAWLLNLTSIQSLLDSP